MSFVAPTSPTDHSMDALRARLKTGFAKGTISLPVLPHVAGRVMTLANNPDADVGDLSDLIHQDQALAGNVLRIANSAAYGLREPIVSLRQAVMQLGMTVLNEIAVAACLQGEAFRAPGYEEMRKKLMMHAFMTGSFAKELARRKRRNVESIFLCGLLHSIGRTLVLREISVAQKGSPTLLPVNHARELMREFHRDAADAVTVAWKLPRQVQVAAVYHENPAAAPMFGDETRLTGLAATIASWIVYDDPVDEAAVRAIPGWTGLNFYPDDVDAVIERREAIAASATVFMS